jgi:hypothetical protein
MKSELERFNPSSVNQGCLGVNLKHEDLVSNKPLHLTAIPLRSIAAGGLCRYAV